MLYFTPFWMPVLVIAALALFTALASSAWKAAKVLCHFIVVVALFSCLAELMAMAANGANAASY